MKKLLPALTFLLLANHAFASTSIPIPGTEVGVTLLDLEDAHGTCLSGNSAGKPGFTSLLEKIARSAGLGASSGEDDGQVSYWISGNTDSDGQRIFDLDRSRQEIPFNAGGYYSAKEPNRNGYDSITIQDVDWKEEGPKWFACGPMKCAFESISFRNSGRKAVMPFARPDRVALTIESNYKREKFPQVILLSEEGRVLPVFSYGEVKKEALYDQMGRKRDVGSLIGPVSIQVEGDLNLPIRFVNARTGKLTKVQVGLQEYVDCLKGEVQKSLARKDSEDNDSSSDSDSEKTAQ